MIKTQEAGPNVDNRLGMNPQKHISAKLGNQTLQTESEWEWTKSQSKQ